MATTYWVPKNQQKFHVLVNQMVTYVTVHAERLNFGENTPSGIWMRAEIPHVLEQYNGIFEKWEDPAERTRSDSTRLRTARAALESLVRTLAAALKASPPEVVTDDDLLHLGIPPRRATKYTRAPIEEEPPHVEINALPPGVIKARYLDMQGGRSGKPRGQHGMECLWTILDSPSPTITLADLTRSAFDTRSPLVLDLGDRHRGKFLYMAFRWENTRGEKGRLSHIYHTMIP
jgi:hypothetical protein